MTASVKNDQKTIFRWAMYDWANSAYATTSGAIVATFFTTTIVPCVEFDAEMECVSNAWGGLSGEAVWSLIVSIGAFVLFLIMPVLGAVADYTSAKRAFLWAFATLGAIFTMASAFVPEEAVPLFLLIFLISQVGFVAANVFYDGFLPELTTEDTIDRVSSKGYALGYIGGGLYVLLAFVLIILSGDEGSTGLTGTGAARVGIFGAGVWWVLFTLYSIRRLPDVGDALPIPEHLAHRPKWRAYYDIGFGRTVATAKKLRGFPQLTLFVIAFILYNDGTQTVINISGAYASGTLNLELENVIIAFLIVQFIAFFGALLFGSIAGRIGARDAIVANLGIWTLLAIGAFFLPDEAPVPFYLLAAGVGFVLGGVQALSRSLYGTMIPEEASAEFYGFFSVFSKFSAIWGPLIFALVSWLTGDSRPAILSVIVFFVSGGYLLRKVDIAAAQASRDEWDIASMDTQ